jgi:hypothetical protein
MVRQAYLATLLTCGWVDGIRGVNRMPRFSLGRRVSGDRDGGVGGLSQAQVDLRIASFAASFTPTTQAGLKGNSYYDYADRTIVALADRDTATQITIALDTGTVYDVHIEQNSDLIHLPDIDTGTSIRLSEGNTLWLGRVESYTKARGVWTFKINFFMRRSTFTVGENIHLEFGAYPLSRTSYLYGYNQTDRVPDVLSAANHSTESNGVKRWQGVPANENIHGGIAHTFLNSNDIADADHKFDADNTGIQIDESGHFHFRFKMFGNQFSDANVRLRFYKVMPGVDDVALLSILAWHTSAGSSLLVSEFFDEEKYVSVTSGDQFILVISEENSARRVLAGYVEIERVD